MQHYDVDFSQVLARQLVTFQKRDSCDTDTSVSAVAVDSLGRRARLLSVDTGVRSSRCWATVAEPGAVSSG